MKLLTYNFLTSSAMKGVKVGYPLILHVSIYENKFVNMMPRIKNTMRVICFAGRV